MGMIYTLIVMDMGCLVLESYKGINKDYGYYLKGFELFTAFIFTAEYILRIWTADLIQKYKGSRLTKRLKFMISTIGIIDLLAILPFFLPYIFPFDLVVLRLLRLLRIFKLSRYSKSLQTINKILRDSKAELSITVFAIFVLLLISSTLMFYMEKDAQPEKFASIGHALWWAVCTLTTVGYGDVYPVTNMGKLLSGLIALIGIGFVAIPTAIISSAFIRDIKDSKSKTILCKCPECEKIFEQKTNIEE